MAARSAKVRPEKPALTVRKSKVMDRSCIQCGHDFSFIRQHWHPNYKRQGLRNVNSGCEFSKLRDARSNSFQHHLYILVSALTCLGSRLKRVGGVPSISGGVKYGDHFANGKSHWAVCDVSLVTARVSNLFYRSDAIARSKLTRRRIRALYCEWAALPCCRSRIR